MINIWGELCAHVEQLACNQTIHIRVFQSKNFLHFFPHSAGAFRQAGRPSCDQLLPSHSGPYSSQGTGYWQTRPLFTAVRAPQSRHTSHGARVAVLPASHVPHVQWFTVPALGGEDAPTGSRIGICRHCDRL